MASASSRKLIGLFGGQQTGDLRHLTDALAELLPVEFCWREAPDLAGLAAMIVLNGDLPSALATAALGVPAFVFLPEMKPAAEPEKGTISFGCSAWIDAALRGRTLQESRAASQTTVPALATDEILASSAAGAVWVARRTPNAECLIATGTPPALGEVDALARFLNGRDFMRALPVICFLRRITEEISWATPTRRACFVFDDPSLYWRSYGFINYQFLAEHARQHNYAVSVATIPLDTWWVNRGVAATLREHYPRLSVMIHGNNHTKREMLAHHSGESHYAVAAQSLRRMEQLESRHGISFSKVMEPPHGALACSILPCLLALGYEGALCTTELLLQHNPLATLPPTIGLKPAEMLGGGLPVLPRIKMSPVWKNEVLLAAFLRQPIILAGHHQDAAEKMQLLAEFAALVNSLEGVVWSDLRGILQANYEQQRAGDTLLVRPYSRQISLTVPSGIRRVQVLRPWVPGGQTERLILAPEREASITLQAGPVSELFAVASPQTITITSSLTAPLHFSAVPNLSTSPRLIVRKFLMEIRDRLTPLFPLVDKLRRPVNPNSP